MESLSAIKEPDRVSILFGSGEKSKSKRTWKQYFSDLYTKVLKKFHKFINSIKSFFKKPANNQVDPKTPKDAADSSVSTQPSQSTDLPKDVHLSDMTPEERSGKVRKLVEYAENGKTYDDLSVWEQRFLLEYVEEVKNHPNPSPSSKNLAIGLSDYYKLSS